MGSIPNDWKRLIRTETSQKFLLRMFCYNTKVARKVKDFQKLSNKEIYFTHQSNSTKYKTLSNSFQGQTSLRNTILSFLISGVKLLLIGLRHALIGSFIFSIFYKLIHFSLPLNPAKHRMGNAPNISVPHVKNSILYFITSFPKLLYTSSVNFITNQSEIRFLYRFKSYSPNNHNGNFFSIP